MNNKKKQGNKGSAIVILVIIIAAFLINSAKDAAFLFRGVRDLDPDVLAPVILCVTFTVFIVVLIVEISKGKAGKGTAKKQTQVPLNRPFPQPTAVKAKQPAPLFHHADEAEEAITCAHHTGKEKYLEQVEGFYKNGLIDRAEYKVLREKYEKLELPEDYH